MAFCEWHGGHSGDSDTAWQVTILSHDMQKGGKLYCVLKVTIPRRSARKLHTRKGSWQQRCSVWGGTPRFSTDGRRGLHRRPGHARLAAAGMETSQRERACFHDAARSACLSLKVSVERHEGDRRRKGGAVHPELMKDAGKSTDDARKAPMTVGP